jgi:hypothetical protein
MSTQVAVENENKTMEGDKIEEVVDETDDKTPDASKTPGDETPAPTDETPAPATKPMRILEAGQTANAGETLYTVTDGKVFGPDETELEDGSLKTEILKLVAAAPQGGGRRRSRRHSKKRHNKRSKKQNGGKKRRHSKRHSKK